MEETVKFKDLPEGHLFLYNREICSKTPIFIENLYNEFWCNAQTRTKGINVRDDEYVKVSDSYSIDWTPLRRG